MIITRLRGGLGNQLFQYAAARRLADQTGQELGFDLRELWAFERFQEAGQGDTPRPFLLSRYPVRGRVLSHAGLLLRGHIESRLWRRGLRAIGWKGYWAEQGQSYRPLPRRRGLYLDGYWQSWRYLEGGRAVLLKDLAPKAAPQGLNARLLKAMAAGNAVCVHVRRGDYVTLAAASSFHGLMGQDYYKAGVKRLGAAARGATYYVFSDEPAWAKRHLPLPGTRVIVGHNSVLEPEQDLRLMAACRHFIIANSSLSWWGAWLGRHRSKKVVAPRLWFKSGPPTPDLCPPDWIRL